MRSAKLKDVGDLSILRYPLIGSPKLDGIRGLILGGFLVSRKLKRIPNRFTRDALDNSAYEGLDGELIAGLSFGPGVFNRTTSAVMTQGGTPPVTFWVFDWWNSRDPYTTRLSSLPEDTDLVDAEDGEGYVRIRRLPYRVLRSEREVLGYEAKCLREGYEGIMLRNPNATYKFGQSTMKEMGLIKMKRFEDSEAEIIGIVEQRHNGNEATINELGLSKRTSHKANKVGKGTTGALRCRDLVTGVEFEIGTGMDQDTCAFFWRNPPVGKIVKYKFQPVGVKDKPRFPVFMGIRED
jgi:DNA ligase-1